MLIPPWALFPDSVYAERRTRARHAMREAGLECCIAIAPESLFYLCGYDSWTAMNNPQALVFTVHDDAPVLLVRDVDLALARESARVADIRTFRVNRDDPAGLIAALVFESGATGAGACVDAGSPAVTGAFARALGNALGTAELADATTLLGNLRLLKSSGEMECMRTAAGFAQAGLDALPGAACVGRTEIAVAADLEHAVRRAGSDYQAIPTELTAGPRSAGCHGTPRPRTMATGELLHVEFAGVCNRYHAVAFSTVALGEPGARARDLYRITAASLRAGVAAARPGVPAVEVELASLAPLEREGLAAHAMMRFGYGVGIAYPPVWLETLQIDRYSEQRLQAGMVFVLHACLELVDESLGVILGGTYALGETGAQMLIGEGDVPLRVL